MDMLEKYKTVSEKFVEEMKKHSDVEGVANLGGIARNRADEFSDIDIAVFSEKELGWLKTGEQKTEEGYDLEVLHISMSNGYSNWSSIKREAYQEAKLAYDKSGNVKKFLDNALYYPDKLRINNSAELIFAMAWHGWIYSDFKGQYKKNYNWILPEDLWFKRGVPKNAFYVTRYCIDEYIELLYAINKRWVSDYKWRYIRVKQLQWLPNDFENKLDTLLYGEWSEKTWESNKLIFQSLIDQAVEKACEYMPEDWYSLI